MVRFPSLKTVVVLMLAAGLAACAPEPAEPAASGPDEVPERTAQAMDMTGRLPAGAIAKLAQRLADFKAEEGADVGVLVVETTGMVPMADYARKVAIGWQLGRPNVADGVLIVYAIGDGAIQIEVGCGLETTIDGARIAALITDEMLPAFERKDYANGLGAAVDQLTTLIARAPLPDATAAMPSTPIWAGEPVSAGCQV